MLLNVVYICEIRLKPMTHRRIYMKTKHIKMLYIVCMISFHCGIFKRESRNGMRDVFASFVPLRVEKKA